MGKRNRWNGYFPGHKRFAARQRFIAQLVELDYLSGEYLKECGNLAELEATDEFTFCSRCLPLTRKLAKAAEEWIKALELARDEARLRLLEELQGEGSGEAQPAG